MTTLSKYQIGALWIGLVSLVMLTAIQCQPTTYSGYWVHSDHLGTPQSLSDAEGNVAWRADYTPYGRPELEVERTFNTHSFPGQQRDEESELTYNHHRYYDCKTGRYARIDPVHEEGMLPNQANPSLEFSSYAYAGGNPVSYADPNGLFIQFVIGIGAAINAGVQAMGGAAAMAQAAAVIAGAALGGVALYKATDPYGLRDYPIECNERDKPDLHLVPKRDREPQPEPKPVPPIVPQPRGDEDDPWKCRIEEVWKTPVFREDAVTGNFNGEIIVGINCVQVCEKRDAKVCFYYRQEDHSMSLEVTDQFHPRMGDPDPAECVLRDPESSLNRVPCEDFGL